MSVAALFLAAASVAAPAPPPGAVLASADVTVTVLKPVAVRQDGGAVTTAETPRYQLTRRGQAILVEFQ